MFYNVTHVAFIHFPGASIPEDAKTVSVDYFENKASIATTYTKSIDY